MLRKSVTGTWFPAWVPESTITLAALLMVCSIVQSTTGGFDGSMINGLNILPAYTNYFNLTPATIGLNTASAFIGGFIGPLFGGLLTDKLGRRPTIFWSCIMTLSGAVLQGGAQNIAMFIIARIILGAGSVVSGIAGGVYLSETFPTRWRAWGVGMLNNFYYVGALIAAGVTLGTGQWQSTWAWRAPSLLQGVFSFLTILILPFVPESPRFLVYKGLHEEARIAVAQTNANGNVNDPVAIAVYKEIVDTLRWEKEKGQILSPKQIIQNPIARRRTLIGASTGIFACIPGNIIASFYLGLNLNSAGVTKPNDQLKANVVLNVWCLFCALCGTQLLAKWGRKPTALFAQCMLTACLFIIGGLSKMFADNPEGASNTLIYGNVAVMFLFQGFFSVAWTPLLYLYPPEVLNYSIRANGLALSFLLLFSFALLLSFTLPIGLTTIGWKMYIINGSWDVIVIFLIAFFWVETKGKTLEEIDAIFEGEKHSDVPDVEDIREGRAKLDVRAVECELEVERVGEISSEKLD